MKQRMGYSGVSMSPRTSGLASQSSKTERWSRPQIMGRNLLSDSERHAAEMTTDMEAQNDELIDELHEKVLGLKQIAFGMRDEVQESSTLLDQMGSAMTTASGLLTGTVRQLRSLISFRTGRHIWLMMLFFVGFIFLLYVFFGKRR